MQLHIFQTADYSLVHLECFWLFKFSQRFCLLVCMNNFLSVHMRVSLRVFVRQRVREREGWVQGMNRLSCLSGSQGCLNCLLASKPLICKLAPLVLSLSASVFPVIYFLCVCLFVVFPRLPLLSFSVTLLLRYTSVPRSLSSFTFTDSHTDSVLSFYLSDVSGAASS